VHAATAPLRRLTIRFRAAVIVFRFHISFGYFEHAGGRNVRFGTLFLLHITDFGSNELKSVGRIKLIVLIPITGIKQNRFR